MFRGDFILYFLCSLCFLHFLYLLPASACLFAGCSSRRLPDYLIVRFVFVYDAKPFGKFPARFQLVEFGGTYPGLRVRLGVIDGDLQFQSVTVQSPVALGQMGLLAARISVGIGPILVVKANRIENESVALPFANRVAQITWVGIFGEWPPVGPDGAPDMLLLEKHEHPSGNLNDLKWIRMIEDFWRTIWITFQGWAVLLARDRLGTHQWSCGIEPGLPPRSQRRTKPLIHSVHAGSSRHIALRILHPNSGQIVGERLGRALSFCRFGYFASLSERERRPGQRRPQDCYVNREAHLKNHSPQIADCT